MPTYSKQEISEALKLYDLEENVTRVVRILGYPTKATLYLWLRQRNPKSSQVIPTLTTDGDRVISNFYLNRKVVSPEIKIEAIKRCFKDGEDVRQVAEEMGVSRQSIHNWRRIVEKNGLVALMNRDKQKIIDKNLTENDSNNNNVKLKELEQVQNEVKSLKLEIDILKEALNLLKKDKGIDFLKLTNREKVMLINALDSFYSIKELLTYLNLSKSSYHYQIKAIRKPSKYNEIQTLIKQYFNDNRSIYGYRRIKILLEKDGVILSEKVIRRLMKEMDCIPLYTKKRKKYSSYQGEITPAPDNILQRDFSASKPNQKWITDITEFPLSYEKVYLSTIVDCFDGKIIAWHCDTTPNADLANKSLLKACASLEDNDNVIIHSDRGGHYRWTEWIRITEINKLTRSMSKKGCTGDNAACEGVFGRIKNECFYGIDFKQLSSIEFMAYLNEYLNWFNEFRIKTKFRCSINQNRKNLGY